MHVQRHAGTKGVTRHLVEIYLVVESAREVVFELQQLLSLVEVGKNKLIRLLERGATCGFVAFIVLGKHHAKCLGSLLVAVVCLAEKLDQLGVS